MAMKTGENTLEKSEKVKLVMKEMVRSMIMEILEGERDEILGYEKYDLEKSSKSKTARNGYFSKVVKSSYGDVEILIPRDRLGIYKPLLIKKYKKDISDFDNKLLVLFSKKKGEEDILECLRDLYKDRFADEQLNRIKDRMIKVINKWRK
jgi:transposase-like protein